MGDTGQKSSPLQAALVRDRWVVLGGVVAVAALAWAYTLYTAWQTGHLGSGREMAMSMAGPSMSHWSAADWTAMFAMWAVMMAAMMVPTAAPMLLMFAQVNRQRLERQQPYVPTMVFLLGYTVVWVVFALAATAGNWALHTHGLLSSMMGASTSSTLGGGLLLAAGLFQWTPLKSVCLSRCRTPMGFIMTGWREGYGGALEMGLKHGAYCLGCCWILMALLFVLGVMNLVWIAGLAFFVLLEKAAPKGEWVSRIGGLLLLVWGGLVISGAWG